MNTHNYYNVNFYFLVPIKAEELAHCFQPVNPTNRLVTIENLDADFGYLLFNVCSILNSCPNKEQKLNKCKYYCSTLRIGDCSNEYLLNWREIEDCSDFNELLHLKKMNWEEHSALTKIAEICGSVKAQNQIKKFEQRLALIEGLQLIYDESKYVGDRSEEFGKFCIIIDKSYNKITLKEYKKIKAYIVEILGVSHHVFTGYMKLLRGSLHIEWLIIVRAIPYMIKMAHLKKDVFINEKFVFMQIGTETIFDKVF